MITSRPTTHLTANKKPERTETTSIADVIKKNPAMVVVGPIAGLIGLDLVLNIVVLVKRTIEFYAFGKVPSTEVWFSDNFFL